MQQVTLEKGAHLKQSAQFSGYGRAGGAQGTRPQLTLIQGGAQTDGGAGAKGPRFAVVRQLSTWSGSRPAAFFAGRRRPGRPGLSRPAVEPAGRYFAGAQDDGPTVGLLVTPQRLAGATAELA
jgi:hypothetical protein